MAKTMPRHGCARPAGSRPRGGHSAAPRAAEACRAPWIEELWRSREASRFRFPHKRRLWGRRVRGTETERRASTQVGHQQPVQVISEAEVHGGPSPAALSLSGHPVVKYHDIDVGFLCPLV